jgi:hypothetical protein
MYDLRAIAIGALVGALVCAIGDVLRRETKPSPKMTLKPGRPGSMAPWSLRW